MAYNPDKPAPEVKRDDFDSLSNRVGFLRKDVGQLRMVADSHGIDIDALEERIERLEARRNRYAKWALVLIGIAAVSAMTSAVLSTLRMAGVIK